MLGIFSRIWQKKSDEFAIVKPVFNNGECISVQNLKQLPKYCQIHVPKKCCTALLQNGWHSSTYPSGEYYLNKRNLPKLNPNAEFSIISFRMHCPINRYWAIQLPYHINGQYFLEPNEEKAFLVLLSRLGTPFNLIALDQWMSEQVSKIINDNHISQNDAIAFPQRLEQFLCDVLNSGILADFGVIISDFQITACPENNCSASDDKTLEDGTNDEIDALIIEENQQKDTNSLISQTSFHQPKVFYRVTHGEQIGPFSIDDLQQQINVGEVCRSTLLWKQGLSAWQPASTFSEFKWLS